MGLFQILLVAHLIADFPLQTPLIFRWKQRGGIWIVPHVLIHLAVLLLLVRNPLAIGFIVVTHFIIDWTKVALDDGKRQGISFVMDQSAHMLVLAGVARYGEVVVPELTVNHLPFILALALISALFMFLNVVKTQLPSATILPEPVLENAFLVSKASGWTAVFSLLFSVQILH